MSTALVLHIGRAFITLAFIGPGAAHLLDAWRNGGSPAATAFAALELSAGLASLFGWRVRWLAAAFAIFLLVDAFVAHPFWSAVPSEQRNQLLHFFKNLALVGAFLLLSVQK
jgi:putative oxidoreductase